jgi:hypothetical protein
MNDIQYFIIENTVYVNLENIPFIIEELISNRTYTIKYLKFSELKCLLYQSNEITNSFLL